MKGWDVRRSWASARIEPANGGFAMMLDDRPLRLPGGAVLQVRAEALARAIAAEWQGAGLDGALSFAQTPLTRLAGTAQERIAPDPRATIDALAAYARSDLLCYRAASPENLVRRQAEAWQPWLDWAARAYDAPLQVTAGIAPIRQNQHALAQLRAAVAACDAEILAGLSVAVPALGSLILGLALAAGLLDAAEAHRLGALDELFQAEAWGEDAEAMSRRAAVAEDVALAARFIALSRGIS